MSSPSVKAIRGFGAFTFAVGIALLVSATAVSAAPAPILLATASTFSVLAGQGVTNTGTTTMSGDLGTCPNPAITGAPTVGGTTHANDEVACNAQDDLTIAYDDAFGRPPTQLFGGPTDLGGMTLLAGVYESPTSLGITGPLTLNAQGDPDSVWIFKAGTTLITEPDSSMLLINGAQACNVFWQIGSSATLGVNSTFSGTIMALQSIAAKTGSVIDGRLLARNGSVTLDANVIRTAQCATTPTSSTSTTIAGGGGGSTSSSSSTSSTTLAGGGGGGSTTTSPGAAGGTALAPTTTTTAAGGAGGAGGPGGGASTNAVSSSTTRSDFSVTQGTPVRAPHLPRTGNDTSRQTGFGFAAIALGALLTLVPRIGRRRLT